MKRCGLVLLVFVCLAHGVAARAGDATHIRNAQPRPLLHVPYAVTPPRLTASSHDPAWDHAGKIARLMLSIGPGGAGLVPMATTVRLLWDERYLYVRFDCVDDNVVSPYTKRDDPLYQADATEVFLDAVGDGRQWYEVELSSKNVVFDLNTVLTTTPRSDAGLLLVPGIRARDYWAMPSYTMTGLRTAAAMTPSGYVTEYAFPAAEVLHRLGRTTYHAMRLRANLLRYDWLRGSKAQSASTGLDARRRLMALNWAPVLIGCPHLSPAAMGTLILDAKRKN